MEDYPQDLTLERRLKAKDETIAELRIVTSGVCEHDWGPRDYPMVAKCEKCGEWLSFALLKILLEGAKEQ